MAVLVSEKHNRLVIPFRDDVAALLPSARPINDSKHLAIPFKHDEVRLLRNLGIDVPAPITTQYKWPGPPPFESQMNTAALLTTNRRAYVLSSMGVGKTRAALFAYDFLRIREVVKKCLVVAPLSTLSSVWENEVFEVFYGLKTSVLHGTREKRIQKLNEDAHIYIINHDGVKTIQKELLDKKFDCVIIDELATYRNRRTDRWKSLRPIVKNAVYAWGLTGSPTPNGPTDAYGQVLLLTPERMRMSFRAFQQQTMRQITQFKWAPREEANDIVHDTMQPSIRYALEDCHDLPPITVSSRDVTLSARQKKAYKQLMNEYAMESKKSDAGVITVVNEAARLNKLIQVGAGFAYTKDGRGEYLDSRERLKATLNLCREAEGKVIIFASYKWAVTMLEHVVAAICHPLAITGATSKAERDKNLTLFKQSNAHRVLVAHPGCMAHGINLQCASTIIWYTPTHSLETYMQANARITRPGQKQHMNIIHLTATPVERRIFKKLARNEKVMGVLLDLFKNQEVGV